MSILQEIFEELGVSLTVMIVLTSFLWYVVYRFIDGWSKVRAFFLINALMFILYTIYLTHNRIYHSEFGGALVWDFCIMFIPLLHTVIIGITTLFVRKYSNQD